MRGWYGVSEWRNDGKAELKVASRLIKVVSQHIKVATKALTAIPT